jgi:hypothetical protein
MTMADVSKLVPFTGYYAMNAAPGAFLSIDTTETVSVAAGVQKTTSVTVNVSMDGKSITPYPFGDGATFEGGTLTIPTGKLGKLTLHLTRHFSDGHLVNFLGTIGSTKVAGASYFNPVPVSAFVGDYYYLDKKTLKTVHVLSIKSDTQILFDFSAFSNPSGQLQQVNSYSYVPAMFVLTFSNISSSASPAKFMLMLGTAGQFGLACSIQDGDAQPQFAPIMALSIL